MCWLLLFSSGWKIFSVHFHFSHKSLFALFVHMFKSTDIHTGRKKCLDSTGQLRKQIWDKYYGHMFYHSFIHLSTNSVHQRSTTPTMLYIVILQHRNNVRFMIPENVNSFIGSLIIRQTVQICCIAYSHFASYWHLTDCHAKNETILTVFLLALSISTILTHRKMWVALTSNWMCLRYNKDILIHNNILTILIGFSLRF